MRSLRTTTKSSPCWLQLEKACVQQRRPNAAKNKINKFFLKISEINEKEKKEKKFPATIN